MDVRAESNEMRPRLRRGPNEVLLVRGAAQIPAIRPFLRGAGTAADRRRYWWLLDGSKDPEVVAFHNKTYGAKFKYADFAPMFTAELFDPDAWAALFKKAGIRYVVLTSKHHEGFTNWCSPRSWNWNACDAGPHRDLVGTPGRVCHRIGVWGGGGGACSERPE